jgi:hypothetical protein
MNLTIALESQGWTVERESTTAYFYNRATWVAPMAYLHILFKGAQAEVLNEVGDLMDLPQMWRDVLSIQNGAILYSGAISLYGANSATALLNRRDVFEQSPFSLVNENRSWPTKDPARFVVIGGYGFDGTRAVLDRRDGSVVAMSRKSDVVLNRWSDVDSWIEQELDRLSMLFDRVFSARLRSMFGIVNRPRGSVRCGHILQAGRPFHRRRHIQNCG